MKLWNWYYSLEIFLMLHRCAACPPSDWADVRSRKYHFYPQTSFLLVEVGHVVAWGLFPSLPLLRSSFLSQTSQRLTGDPAVDQVRLKTTPSANEIAVIIVKNGFSITDDEKDDPDMLLFSLKRKTTIKMYKV